VSKFLTPPQIAAMLGVQVGKVLRWIDRGELVALNLAECLDGKRPRWKVSQQALDDFLDSRTPAKPAPRARRKKSQADNDPGYVSYYGATR
jgi:hypothetical protein